MPLKPIKTMAICPSDYYENKLKSLWKMSMVPLPCQEVLLGPTGCTSSENMEWVVDLKEGLPIWSRLITINTSGYSRKLPMSMTMAYDIEVKDRLWSLWGTFRRKHLPLCNKRTTDKPYLAASVMALCAARVFRLNLWTSKLLDSIYVSAERYLRASVCELKSKSKGFQLKNLSCHCSLEGINFTVCIKSQQEGRLYTPPLKGNSNLAFALINFFTCRQFGIVECLDRYLAFGYIQGGDGGYFMFDAQSMNYPLYRKDCWAPYILRTNHLQILLYCIVVTLNVPRMETHFAIHHVDITVFDPHEIEEKMDPCIPNPYCKCRCLPKEYWDTPQMSQECDDFLSIPWPNMEDKNKSEFAKKYKRIPQEPAHYEVGNCLTLPCADNKKKIQEKNDFVKLICSDTIVPLTPGEKRAREEKGFVNVFPEAFFMR